MTTPSPTPSPGPLVHPEPQVAQALHALEGLAQRPVEEHVELFDGLHRTLQDVLATLDEV